MTRCKFLILGAAVATLLGGLHSYAQAGTLPTTTATVSAHLEADTQGLGNGASVNTWSATLGLDANSEGGTSTPTFLTGWSPTDLPDIVFDGGGSGAGADDRLLLGRTAGTDSAPGNLPEAEAIFVVLQMNGTGYPEQQLILGGDSFKVMGVRNGLLFTTDQPAAGNRSFNDTSSLHVLSWTRGKPLRIDGVENGSDTADALFSNISIIGDERLSPPDNPGPDMTFGEIILFETGGAAMSDVDRANVEGHLMQKWLGVPEPSSLALLAMGGLALSLRRRTR